MATQTKTQKPNLVLGRVVDKLNRPLANLVVQAFSRVMRAEKLLGESVTDKNGKYEIPWLPSRLGGRGKKEADIGVRVITRKKKTLLYASGMDEVRYKASPREEINITIETAIRPEVVEYDSILEQVTSLAGKIAIADLQDSKGHQDIVFLSKETGIVAEKIEHLAVAHRLHKISKIAPDFFYALLRKNTLLHSDFSGTLRARLAIGVNTEERFLLYDAALTDAKKIEADIKAAAAGMIVAPSVAKQAKRSIEMLSRYKKEAEAYYKNEHPKKAIALLAAVFKKEKLAEVQQLFKENKNDLNTFFEKITNASFFESKEKEREAKTNIALGKLLGFGSEVLPRMIKTRKITRPEDIRKLARLNKAEWEREISKANPEVKDKQLIGAYASAIVRKFEKEFPTAAFAAQLEREKKPVLKNQDKIVAFLNRNEDFDLAKNNIALFLKASGEDKAIGEELKSVQRVFKLVPHYGKALALRNQKIDSSYKIAAVGQKRFVKEVAPKAGLSEKEARDVYRKAEAKQTAAMLVVGDLLDSKRATAIASFETKSLVSKLEAVSKDFPNLKSLFNLTDTCECEHCRSVYSPAAYLVEILQFLDKRTVKTGNAKSVLFNRRPDLGEIDLSCANVNTPVKYIDLVCELLEEAIAPDQGIDFDGKLFNEVVIDGVKQRIVTDDLRNTLIAEGWPVTDKANIFGTETETGISEPYYLRDDKVVCKITGAGPYKIYRLRQTLSTAEELAAAPEYVHDEAYKVLSNEAGLADPAKKCLYAFKLPFDLNHTEARAYFNRFDISRADLMKTFQAAGNPADAAIAAERLGITEADRKIIAGTPNPNDNAAQQVYWSVPAPGDVVDYLEQVGHFLDRTGLSYKDLDLLLKLEFIDKSKKLFIHHEDLTCDTAKKKIADLDLDALDRIHRFLRLQKKTGWKYEVLDAVISQKKLGDGNLDDACLIKAAQLKEIEEKTGIKVEELIGCFGEFPHDVHNENAPKPLYHRIFLNKARNGVVDEGLLPEKVDGSQALAAFKGYIATCLQVKEKDFESLLQLLPDNKLTFSNLSYLYAASRLIKKLKLKPADFSILAGLTGFDITASPETDLKFIKTVEDFSKSPLKAADVKFLLKHEADNLNSRVMSDAGISDLLTKLKKEYEKIISDLKSRFVDLEAGELQDVLITELSGLAGVSDDDVKIILKFVDKDWVSAADAKQFIDARFDKGIDRTAINSAIDALDAAAGDISAEQKDLVKALLDSIAAFRIMTAKRSVLDQVLSASFKTGTDVISVVVSFGKLKQPGPGSKIIGDLLLDNFENPISEANYLEQYATLRLLHKIMFLINALKLNSTDMEWYFKNNKDLGWFELDGIPYAAGQTAVDFLKYLSFVKVINYAAEFSPAVNPADNAKPVTFFNTAEMALPAGAAGKEDLMQALALLTGHEKDDLGDIDARLFPAFDKTNYREMETWEGLLKCAGLMHSLSASAAQIINYIKPSLTSGDVNGLRATLKSRYDEDTWLSTLKEIMDGIRPQKRDALVAYLLATHSDINDENDLYEYFLVDVEMESCMPSSRIVLAHNSIQLFVQRCLLGLEPDAIADVDQDPNWSQWKWMKNYRVWEANRKVFLYPENWYDVTLADDKSQLLSEFINELQQNELTSDTAEDALKRYLEKLDNIAFLEVMATWYDVPTKNMHIFARSKGGDPALYYYRRFEKERYWTPWEKVDLDITGDHLLAFMRNNRLCLAWPVFSEEPRPDQQTKVPSTSQQGSYVDPDRPERKLKIQLAISEHSNKKWQPKKISKDAIKTPPGENDYTADLIPKEYFKLFYNQWADQIVCFNEQTVKVWHGEFDSSYQNIIVLAGAFDIAGCKGYPELASPKPFTLDFIPKFRDTSLMEQRYKEMDSIAGNDLSAVNVYSLLSGMNFLEILNQTPGRFRISYPHQFTGIDLIAFMYQLLLLILLRAQRADKRFSYKIPLGTLLPYFEEDSNHAYVIIPGFYKKETEKEAIAANSRFNDSEKRTVSDVFHLLDDIVNWFKKMVYEFQTNPPADGQAALDAIIKDPGFQDILEEIGKYEALDFILNFLIGKTGNAEFDAFLKDISDSQGLVYGEQFKNMYHPLVCALRTTLYKDGIPALMKRETQLQQKTSFNFETYYKPNTQIVPRSFYKNPDGTLTPSFPVEDIDFTSDGSYSLYNWDLFFRVPLHIACSLTKNQRFEDALTWFHYIFNPTGALSGDGVQKYWVTKPFYLNQEADYLAQRIDNLMYSASDSTNPDIKELEFAISEWRDKPFRPDVVARFRPVAYQKALLMKYIDNLTEWGDYLFRQDTMESVAQATQMYILADKLLGPKPRIIPPVVKAPYETYNQIEGKLDSFGNALVELENILPDVSVLPEGGAELPPLPVTLSMLYFCVPSNEKMFEYWDRVADRLFKIRHCQNIDGVERSLALFAPPIDPGMLVRAAAAGLDISSVLAGLNAPTPYYRFSVLSQKATELAQEVRGLGNSLLQALEKKDAEALSLLRSELELKVLNAVKDIKKLQINEAKEQIEILKRTRKVTEERHKYYKEIEFMNALEITALGMNVVSTVAFTIGSIMEMAAGGTALVPTVTAGAAGFGGSPVATSTVVDGEKISSSISSFAKAILLGSQVIDRVAGGISTIANYQRRFDDWKLQERLAKKELDSIDKQIKAAEIRKEIAETDLKNHELQIENAKKTDEFMRSKFTNRELYDWMIGQISSVYFKAYQLTHDFAKKTERCYRFELGNDDSFIFYGYWDSLKKGLQSADHLIHDIKRMETSYLDKNKREYELTKHVSLAMLDPLALVRLRATGTCDFDVPEVLFDMDYSGQYFRRIKSVSISLPCVAGPYTSISAKLSLVNNRYRKNTSPDNLAGTGYPEDPGNDERFVYNVGAIQSIAASNAQNDSGIFELNFKDERYLPFEGTGAVSGWRLELPKKELSQFNYETISDVIVHIKYTAREGGSTLKGLAEDSLKGRLADIKQQLSQTGLHVALNMKHDLSNEWHIFKKNGSIDLIIDKSRLPYIAQSIDAAIENVVFLAKVKNNPVNFSITLDGNEMNLARIDAWKLCRGNSADIDLDTPFALSVDAGALNNLEELMMVVKYVF